MQSKRSGYFQPLPHQSRKFSFYTAAFIFLAVFCSSCSLSFAADVTPPPPPIDTSTARVNQQSTAVNSYPILLPNLQNGKNIYQDKCASCHGENGMGNGPQASQLPYPVTVLGNLDMAIHKNPVEWFGVVTNGNMDRSMPDFKATLSDRQRWDVVAYLFTLGYPPESMVEGERIYRQECELCHGSGAGDGIVAVEMGLKQPDWLDPSQLVGYSAAELMDGIANGFEAGMPSFSERLSQDQIQSVAGFIQTYGFTSLDVQEAANGSLPRGTDSSGSSAITTVPGVTPAAEGESSPGIITVIGNVSNGSGGLQPVGGLVTLQGFTGMDQAFSLTTDLQSDGSYRFDEVELLKSPILLASVEYEGVTFFSEFLPVMDVTGGEQVELPILVYDSTQDLTGLTADRVHIFLNFPQEDRLQVVELFVISNTSSLVVVPEQAGQPVVRFVLPAGAENLQFEEGTLGDRFVETEDGFGDTAAILPGNTSHQILFAFEMPYKRKMDLTLQFPMDIQAALVALPAGKVKLESSQLTDSGQRSIDGTQVQMFQGRNIQKGSPLELALSGKPEGVSPLTTSNNTNIAIGLAALGISLVMAGWWYARTHPKAGSEEPEGESTEQGVLSTLPDTVESLLDEIVALDDIYKAGELTEEVYIERRADLKRRLANLRNSAISS